MCPGHPCRGTRPGGDDLFRLLCLSSNECDFSSASSHEGQKKLGWQTWGEAAFFELAEVPGGVTSEAALLATAFPTFVQVGPQPPPIFYVPCPQLKSFLRTESGGQTRHYAHRPLYHQPRRRLLAPAGPPLMVAVRPEQVLQVVVRPRDVRRVVAAEQPAPVTPGYLHEPPQLPGHDWVLGFGRRLADLAQQA